MDGSIRTMMQPKDIAGGIPGSSKFSYISILPTSTPTTLQPVTMATASQNVHQTLPSSAAGQILNTSNSVFPQPITIHQLEGTTVSIPVAENQGSSQLHVQQNVTNNQSAIGVAGTNGCQQVDIAHRNDSQGAAQACGPSYGMANVVSKASEIQTVFIKQIDVNGLQETIFVDGDNHQVSLPQGVQVIDLLQDGTPQNDESNALSPHNVGPAEQPLYVNAKQYHRILKRREARARLEARGKITKGRSKFLYNSRHVHAAKRVRGPGGKFLKRHELEQMNKQNENKSLGDMIQLAASDNTSLLQTFTLQCSS